MSKEGKKFDEDTDALQSIGENVSGPWMAPICDAIFHAGFYVCGIRDVYLHVAGDSVFWVVVFMIKSRMIGMGPAQDETKTTFWARINPDKDDD
jgi:hypothetical protein